MYDTKKPIRVFRGEYIESTHDIHIAVVSAKGELAAYYGDPHRVTFARSSMKPFQALPIVESNAIESYNISKKELALFCASHSGEPIHRESVANVLEKLGLSEVDLQCGTHVPRDKASYNILIKNGEELTPFYSNCSGKHSGMLTGCLQKNLDIHTYREIGHPYQQEIMETIADVSNYDKTKIAMSVDGCGVPVHRLPMYQLALSFSRLAAPDKWETGNLKRKEALSRVRDAMTNHPKMVAGTKRFDTDLMSLCGDRIVSKGGAEGVHCFGDRQTGLGVAVKVEDGGSRGTNVASMEVLKQLDLINEYKWNQLSDYSKAPVLNARDEKIGEINASFRLNFL